MKLYECPHCETRYNAVEADYINMRCTLYTAYGKICGHTLKPVFIGQEITKPPVNLKVEFAHGVTHFFNKVDASTFADFDEWLTCVDRKEQFYILENGGQKYYLNREFICAVSVRATRPVSSRFRSQ